MTALPIIDTDRIREGEAGLRPVGRRTLCAAGRSTAAEKPGS